MRIVSTVRPKIFAHVCAVFLWIAAGVSPVLIAADFKLTPVHPQAELGEPFDVVLESSDASLDRARIERVEFVANPDLWHITEPWKPIEGNRKISPEQTDRWLWRATVQGLDVGRLTLPETHVFLKSEDGNTRTDILATTTSMLIVGIRDSNDTRLDLLGPKPVRKVPPGWGWVWAALGGLAGIALLAWLLLRKIRARRAAKPAAPPEPLLPPGPWALREIERRRTLPECKPGHAKEIDSHASEILRVYLGRRFGFAAIDMTTHECLGALQNLNAPPDLVPRVRKFLNECDLVKFSKFEPDPSRWDGIWDDAKSIIESGTPPEEIAEAERLLRDWRAQVEALA